MAALQDAFRVDASPADYARQYIEHLCGLMRAMDTEAIGRAIVALQRCAERGGTVYFAGNGGSAAIASHCANDFRIGAAAPGHPPFKAMSLLDNCAVASCIANDFGFEHVFRMQLDGVIRPDDVLVALSVSGNSPNIVEAVRLAKDAGATVIGCTGFDGGRLRELSDISLHCAAERGEYGPVEDIFQVLDHLMVSYFQLTRRGHL